MAPSATTSASAAPVNTMWSVLAKIWGMGVERAAMVDLSLTFALMSTTTEWGSLILVVSRAMAAPFSCRWYYSPKSCETNPAISDLAALPVSANLPAPSTRAALGFLA